MIMNLDKLTTIEQMEAFINGSQAIAFAVASGKAQRYSVVENILKRFNYAVLRRASLLDIL